MHMVPIIVSMRPSLQFRLNIPVVSRNAVAVLHGLPSRPGLDRIPRLPDALSPYDVLDIMSRAIPHDPLRDLTPGNRSSLSSSSAIRQ